MSPENKALDVPDFIRLFETGKYSLAIGTLIRLVPEATEDDDESMIVDSVSLINKDFPAEILVETLERLIEELKEESRG